MRALTTTLAILALTGSTASALAQQGVRSKSPRRDAGQNALRMIAQEQASRQARQQPGPIEGPSNVAPRYPYPYRHGVRHHGGGISFGGRSGDFFGRVHVGDHRHHHGDHHDIVYVGRYPYYVHNGSYYRYRGYDPYYEPTRRQVVQSPTVIVIDRTGVSTNEVDPKAPVTVDEDDRVSARDLGARALHAGDAGQAVELLTEHVLVHEGDRKAERLLGVALLLDGQTELGIALISRAYTGDPEMAFAPLGRDTIDSLSAWRSVQRDVQRYAGVQRTASAWLAAIVLTQEELPNRTHAERLEQARRAGLDVDVADAFERYLEGGQPLTTPAEAQAEVAPSEPAAEDPG
jgi:hypothetical protein